MVKTYVLFSLHLKREKAAELYCYLDYYLQTITVLLLTHTIFKLLYN